MISNYNLELFLMNHFGKNVKDVSEEQLRNLEMLSLDGIDISGIYETIDFKQILDMFPNVKSLVINNYVFTDEDIISINRKNIEEYSFYKCDFTNISKYDIINHTKTLLFERCIFNDYQFLNNGFEDLNVLCITNPADEEEIDLEKVSCIHLEELYLERCIIKGYCGLNRFDGLVYLNLLETEISKEDVECLINCPVLDTVCISERFVDAESVSKLSKKGINIKFNNNDMLIEREEL